MKHPEPRLHLNKDAPDVFYSAAGRGQFSVMYSTQPSRGPSSPLQPTHFAVIRVRPLITPPRLMQSVLLRRYSAIIYHVTTAFYVTSHPHHFRPPPSSSHLNVERILNRQTLTKFCCVDMIYSLWHGLCAPFLQPLGQLSLLRSVGR